VADPADYLTHLPENALHERHLKTIVEEKQSQTDENVCPKCGRPMALRTARRGDNQGKQFLGCTGYPKCRTVRQTIYL
jgi:restriction system protein